MERIWAPWRLSYVSACKAEAGCIFCPGQPDESDRDRLILHRSQYSLIMLNRYPYSGGHLMVAPLRHISDLGALTDEETLDIMREVSRGQYVLERVARPDGFNIGINVGRAAGAGVEDHLHIHIVPRWNGDSNFMTVIGDIRVIPDGLMDAYDRFKSVLTEEGAP